MLFFSLSFELMQTTGSATFQLKFIYVIANFILQPETT